MEEKQIKVLIAEDDDQFRLLVERLLVPDYIVINAENGEDALKIAQTEQPDVILTDVLMPKMTGIDLLKQIKDGAGTTKIPVIILLATATANDIKAAESLNANGILPKEDVSRDALDSVIKSVVN